MLKSVLFLVLSTLTKLQISFASFSTMFSRNVKREKVLTALLPLSLYGFHREIKLVSCRWLVDQQHNMHDDD